MNLKNYNTLNKLIGWLVFILAATVYILTLEPTASWWDCGEFIATSYKLQIGHPPGNPVFMILGRFFTLFAFGDVKLVAYMANLMSALASAFTILFLFWTITALAKKIVILKDEAEDFTQTIVILGCGFVGSMAYTFTDSFWFSAVEGEVYAMSALFTAVVFWAILKWEASSSTTEDRWIVLIAFLIGTSIGVHLLNLLTIPALGFVIYFKKYKTTLKGVVITTLLSSAVLLFVLYGIIPGVVKLIGKFELLFTNVWGFSFGTGFYCFSVLLIAIVVGGIYFSAKKKKRILNISMLSLAMILIGYSMYTIIVIRSQANTPINENGPDNIFSLQSYINREQYGDRPLFYGQYYNAKVIKGDEGAMDYKLGDNQYIPVGRKYIPVYDPANCGILPRMHSSNPNHIFAYKEWASIRDDRKPTFAENWGFFLNYQVNYMYWRYFMWNFAGRQNDKQGDGIDFYGDKDMLNGNWYSGIPFIDRMHLGSQADLPQSVKQNKGMNRYYFLPFILGFIGLFYHFKKNTRDGIVVMMLFLLTGLAIVFYLNQTPFQPRERDYSYAGSFYAFAIWIGLGVAACYQTISKIKKGTYSALITIGICTLLVPCVLARDGWDDHDRSHKTSTSDFAYNYLMSCAPNAVLFSNGDNDTFALWYLQEVEGIRTDVRVVNYTLLSGDWYIHQMFRKVYDSEPLPLSLNYHQYDNGTNDYLEVDQSNVDGFSDLKKVIDFIGSDNENTKLTADDGSQIAYVPTAQLSLKVDTNLVKQNGTVPAEMQHRVASEIEWKIRSGYIYKNDLMLLDFLANNNWKRPIYFVSPSSVSTVVDIKKYCYQEGFAYRFIPVIPLDSNAKEPGININRCYDVLMNKCKWGGMDKYNLYLDGETERMATLSRNTFAKLAQAILTSGKRDSALAVLDKSRQMIPEKNLPYNYYMVPYVELYYRANAASKANTLANRLTDIYEDNLRYYSQFTGPNDGQAKREKAQAERLLKKLVELRATYK